MWDCSELLFIAVRQSSPTSIPVIERAPWPVTLMLWSQVVWVIHPNKNYSRGWRPNVIPALPWTSVERASGSRCLGRRVLPSCASHQTSLSIVPVGGISSRRGRRIITYCCLESLEISIIDFLETFAFYLANWLYESCVLRLSIRLGVWYWCHRFDLFRRWDRRWNSNGSNEVLFLHAHAVFVNRTVDLSCFESQFNQFASCTLGSAIRWRSTA